MSHSGDGAEVRVDPRTLLAYGAGVIRSARACMSVECAPRALDIRPRLAQSTAAARSQYISTLSTSKLSPWKRNARAKRSATVGGEGGEARRQFARGAGARAACRRACARAPRPRARPPPRPLPLPFPFPLAPTHTPPSACAATSNHASRGSKKRLETTLPPSDGSSCASAVSTRRARVHPQSRS